MKVIITGSNGQLGQSLIKSMPKQIKLFEIDRSKLDMRNSEACKQLVRNIRPDWIVNCGAFTNVDLAENNEENVMKINADAPKAFAEELNKYGGKMLQISSDYVFDGVNRNLPYETWHPKSPLGMYGFSKAKSEEYIESILSKKRSGIILRTSWLIGPYGHNFIKTILKLNSIKNEINVVNDQVGCPTSSLKLAEVCWRILNLNDYSLLFKEKNNGILHWNDNGQTTWFELARSILDMSREIGLIKNKSRLIPIKTSEYPYKAKRPLYSVLESDSTKKILDIQSESWKVNLKEILFKIKNKEL